MRRVCVLLFMKPLPKVAYVRVRCLLDHRCSSAFIVFANNNSLLHREDQLPWVVLEEREHRHSFQFLAELAGPKMWTVKPVTNCWLVLKTRFPRNDGLWETTVETSDSRASSHLILHVPLGLTTNCLLE